MDLGAELNKSEYATGSWHERLALLHSKTVPTLGKIRGDKIKSLQSFIGATHLRQRLSNATADQHAAAASIAEAIQPAYLAAEDTFSINLADPTVSNLMALAVNTGLLTQEEAQYLNGLATYQHQTWGHIVLKDIVAHFAPALLDANEPVEVEIGNLNKLRLQLTAALPEPALIRIEMSESDDNLNWTAFKRVNHFYSVHQPDFYFAAVPNNGLHRRVRVCSEIYRFTGALKAV